MAKKATSPRKARSQNKAQAIRDEFSAQGGTARPKDVIAALKDKGVVVSSAQVSNIKATLFKKKRGGRKAANGHAGNGAITLTALLETKKLASRLGGLAAVKQAVEALSQLS
jgi:hypothetical protein